MKDTEKITRELLTRMDQETPSADLTNRIMANIESPKVTTAKPLVVWPGFVFFTVMLMFGTVLLFTSGAYTVEEPKLIQFFDWLGRQQDKLQVVNMATLLGFATLLLLGLERLFKSNYRPSAE